MRTLGASSGGPPLNSVPPGPGTPRTGRPPGSAGAWLPLAVSWATTGSPGRPARNASSVTTRYCGTSTMAAGPPYGERSEERRVGEGGGGGGGGGEGRGQAGEEKEERR